VTGGAGFIGSHLCERLLERGDEMNLGNPAELTIRELAETILSLTGSASKLVPRPLPADDPHQRQPDIVKAQELLAWSPKVPLRAGLMKTIECFEILLTSQGE